MKFTKLLIAVAVMACAVGLQAAPGMKTNTISTVWALSVYTNDVVLEASDFTGAAAVPAYRQLDKVIVLNNTAGSVSMAVQAEELPGNWVTLTGSPVVAGAGALAVGYPARLVAETIAGYVVTGDVAVATTSTVSKPVPYDRVTRLRLIATMASTNAPSTIQWGVGYR